MKNATNVLRVLGVAVFVLLAASCSTTKQTENLLSAAGFKVVPATTPQQQAHLKTLPPDKVTMVPRDGSVYYVYPDPAQQVLYVGQEAQYQEYQRLRLQNQLAEEKVEAAQMNSEASWGAWGPWVGGGVVVPVMRR
ncbi:MAG TPA: hypothetical protein PLX89_13935 [Verrucomicrobiota bacterium]|nr:hypothetical protein [Verrucomicrobiales bacterium]HRI14093.1 hypothetical protein [Verrucomicrobiota bacterium]